MYASTQTPSVNPTTHNIRNAIFRSTRMAFVFQYNDNNNDNNNMGNQIFLTVRRHEWHLNESLPTQAPTKCGINFTPIRVIIYIYIFLMSVVCVCDVYSTHVSSRITIVRQKYRYFFLNFFFFFELCIR